MTAAFSSNSILETSANWQFTFDPLDENASIALAHDLALVLKEGDVLALDGDLGLGKSTLARALLRARADDPYLEVPSPTFTLVQDYQIDDLSISHFDLYRISDFEELYEIGLEESWQDGCALIEWPDRAEDLLPAETLWLHFEQGDNPDARRLTLSGSVTWADRLQRLCEKRALLIGSGWGDALRDPIAGDLSPRSYDRVKKADASAVAIMMDSPERQPGPELADGRLYDEVAHRVTRLAPMVSITENLDTLGLRVPHIYGHQLDQGLMLWEDFGAETLATGPEAPIAERFMATLSALARLHERDIPTAFDGSGGIHPLSRFDPDALSVELDVFLDWYWPYTRGDIEPEALTNFKKLWTPLLDRLQKTEQSLVLRDVQDPNCFWLGDDNIGFIDFQDCMIGPAAYDIAALCLDARVTICPTLESQLKAHYCSERQFSAEQIEAFEEAYALCGAQRTSKNLGAFARAHTSLGRSDYLEHIPRGLDYLGRVLEHPALTALGDFYRSHNLLARQ